MWDLYCDGHPQLDIAGWFGISQARVSQILGKWSTLFPPEDQDEIVNTFKLQLAQAIQAIMPKVRRGDSTAIRDLVKVQERACRMLGLDRQKELRIAAGPEGSNEVHYIIEADEEIIEALK
jgi:hypothetical protein